MREGWLLQDFYNLTRTKKKPSGSNICGLRRDVYCMAGHCPQVHGHPTTTPDWVLTASFYMAQDNALSIIHWQSLLQLNWNPWIPTTFYFYNAISLPCFLTVPLKHEELYRSNLTSAADVFRIALLTLRTSMWTQRDVQQQQ